MSEEMTRQQGSSRRSFLKTAGAATIASAVPAGLAGCSQVEDQLTSEEKTYHSMCFQTCMTCCRLKCKVRDGHVTEVTAGNLGDYTRVCVKGMSHAQRIYKPTRIKYPMRRVGERGEGKFERISWDEALTEVGDNFKSTIAKYGSQSICFFFMAGMNEYADYLCLMRMANALSATTINGGVDQIGVIGTDWVFAGYNIGDSMNDVTDIRNAKTVMLWATNPPATNVHEWRMILDARDNNGAKLVCIDPNFTIAASQSDMHVTLRPGSDSALVLGMCKQIVDNGWNDEEFLREHTVAPFLVRSDTHTFLRAADAGFTTGDSTGYMVLDSEGAATPLEGEPSPKLLGEVQVNDISCKTAYQLLVEELQRYTPEYVEQLTDVSPDVMTELARMAACDKPVTHYLGYSQWDNGYQFGHALATLASLVKGVGTPGNMITTRQRPGSLLTNLFTLFLPSSFTMAGSISVCAFDEIVLTGKHLGQDYPIKAAYIAFANPAFSVTDQNSFRKALLALDFIAVADMRFNDTTKYADIVLPVAYFFEKPGVFPAHRTPYVLYNEQAVEPAFEAKSDAQIIIDLAKKLDLEHEFNFTVEDAIKMCFYTPETYEAVKQAGAFYENKPLVRFADYNFPTPSGRMEFYQEAPQPNFAYGQVLSPEEYALPKFVEPAEAWPTNPAFKDYSYVLLSDRKRWHLHSNFHELPVIKELDPEPLFRINPEDAAEKGIETGEYVECFNSRGSFVCKCLVDPSMRRGVTTVSKGWGDEAFVKGIRVCSVSAI